MSVLPFPAPVLEETPIADAEERRLALDIHQSWIVEAPAGSGKTGLLVQRMLQLLANVDHPSEVLAITFTNKATAEMRTRVLEALQSATHAATGKEKEFELQLRELAAAVLHRDEERGWGLLRRPYLLRVRTMDALCGEIARALPILSGGTGRMKPVPDASLLYHDAARRLLRQLGGPDARLNRDLETVLLHRDADLGNCEALIAEMLATREQWGHLVPLTGAELTDEYLDAEVRPRLQAAIETAICGALCDLHDRFPETHLRELAAIASSLAHAEGPDDAPNAFLPCAGFGSKPGTRAEDLEHWRLLGTLLLTSGNEWRRAWNVKMGARFDRATTARLKLLVERLREHEELIPLFKTLRELPAADYPDEQWEVAKALFRLLRLALVELDLLFARDEVCDFTHIALGARSALRDSGTQLQEALGTSVRHMLVDEMQDTSSGQYELLELLTEGWDGQQQTVFLVGDPKQSIYLFRQARVERFQQCISHRQLGSIHLQVLRLCTNFRSGATLVRGFNEMFQAVFPESNPEDGDVPFAAASAALPASRYEELRWHITPLPTFERGDPQRSASTRQLQADEAEHMADLIQHYRGIHKANGKPHTIAVLARAKTHVALVTQVLGQRSIPFRAVEIEELGERREVLDAVALTRALAHPADRTAWLAVLHAPWCGLGLADLHTLAGGDDPSNRRQAMRPHLRARVPDLRAEVRPAVERTLDVLDAAVAQMGRTGMSALVERTWRSLGGPACTDASGRVNVQLFFELLDAMEGEGTPFSPEELQQRLEKLFAMPASLENAVDIMTIHKAKGLEWDVVLLPGLHKQGAKDNPPLLDWMELSAAGQASNVLLAPIQSRGEDPHSLNRFIQSRRRRRVNLELKRLFYVAATRARLALHLFASPCTNKDGIWSHPSATLLGAGWPAVPQQDAVPEKYGRQDTSEEQAGMALAAASETGAKQAQTRPKLVRLRKGFDAAAAMGQDVRFVAASQPSNRKPFERPQGSFGARAVGNAIHACMERMVREIEAARAAGQSTDAAMEWLLASIPAWTSAVRTILRSGGISPESLDHAVDITMTALRNTLADANGRWLLLPHAASAVESAWRADAADTPLRVRLDRSFFAGSTPYASGTDTLWIVDFKTGNHTQGVEKYLEEERSKYEQQLRTYAEVRLRTLPEGTPVMLALYYPLMRRIRFWPMEPGGNG